MTVKVRFVRAGEVIPTAVEGGVVRRPAPMDGLLVDSGESIVFVSAVDVRKCLRRRKAQ